MSELHMQYSEIMAIGMCELRGILWEFKNIRETQNKQYQTQPPQPPEEEGLDCELVDEDDYENWGISQ